MRTRWTGVPVELVPFEQFPLRRAGDRTAACAHGPPARPWSGACRCRHVPRVPSRVGAPVERMRDAQVASCPFRHLDPRHAGDRCADCAGARGACRCLSVAQSRHGTERPIHDRPFRHTGAGSAGGSCAECAVRPGWLPHVVRADHGSRVYLHPPVRRGGASGPRPHTRPGAPASRAISRHEGHAVACGSLAGCPPALRRSKSSPPPVAEGRRRSCSDTGAPVRAGMACGRRLASCSAHSRSLGMRAALCGRAGLPGLPMDATPR
jgi:hypothetical protein